MLALTQHVQTVACPRFQCILRVSFSQHSSQDTGEIVPQAILGSFQPKQPRVSTTVLHGAGTPVYMYKSFKKSWIAIPFNPSFTKSKKHGRYFTRSLQKHNKYNIIFGQNKITSNCDKGNTWYLIFNYLRHRRYEKEDNMCKKRTFFLLIIPTQWHFPNSKFLLSYAWIFVYALPVSGDWLQREVNGTYFYSVIYLEISKCTVVARGKHRSDPAYGGELRECSLKL